MLCDLFRRAISKGPHGHFIGTQFVSRFIRSLLQRFLQFQGPHNSTVGAVREPPLPRYRNESQRTTVHRKSTLAHLR